MTYITDENDNLIKVEKHPIKSLAAKRLKAMILLILRNKLEMTENNLKIIKEIDNL